MKKLFFSALLVAVIILLASALWFTASKKSPEKIEYEIETEKEEFAIGTLIMPSQNTPGWLNVSNKAVGFTLEYPSDYEFEDQDIPYTTRDDHSIALRAGVGNRDAFASFHITIHSNVGRNLEDFINSYAPSTLNPPSEEKIVGSKKVRESITPQIPGPVRTYYWIDVEKRRGVRFSVVPSETEHLTNFWKIIESFEFI